MTSSRGEGTEWAGVLADASRARFDAIVAVDVDRLLRTITDLVAVMETGAKVMQEASAYEREWAPPP